MKFNPGIIPWSFFIFWKNIIKVFIWVLTWYLLMCYNRINKKKEGGIKNDRDRKTNSIR